MRALIAQTPSPKPALGGSRDFLDLPEPLAPLQRRHRSLSRSARFCPTSPRPAACWTPGATPWPDSPTHSLLPPDRRRWIVRDRETSTPRPGFGLARRAVAQRACKWSIPKDPIWSGRAQQGVHLAQQDGQLAREQLVLAALALRLNRSDALAVRALLMREGVYPVYQGQTRPGARCKDS